MWWWLRNTSQIVLLLQEEHFHTFSLMADEFCESVAPWLSQCYLWVREGILIPRHWPWPAVPSWLCGLGNSCSGLDSVLVSSFLPFFFPVLRISQTQSIRDARPVIFPQGYLPALHFDHFLLDVSFLPRCTSCWILALSRFQVCGLILV